MKKLYILTAFLTLIGLGASAQCTPDMSHTELGVYPSTLPNLCEGDNLDQVLTIVAPNSAQFDYNGFPVNLNIDTVWIKDVKNLPNGASFTCETPECYIATKNDLNYTCINVDGNSLAAYDNEIEVVLTVRAYAPGIGSQKVDTSYTIPLTIDATGTAGCIATSSNDFDFSEDDLSIYPNPVSSTSSVYINLNSDEYAEVELFNIVGEKKANVFRGKLTSGNNKVSLSNKVESLEKGIYLLKVTLPESNNSYMKRIIVQ